MAHKTKTRKTRKGKTGTPTNVAARNNAIQSNAHRLADFFGKVREELAAEIKAGGEMLDNGVAMMATGDTLLVQRGQKLATKGAKLVELGPKAEKAAAKLANVEAMQSDSKFEKRAENMRALNLQAVRILGTINAKASKKIVAIADEAGTEPVDLKKSAAAFRSLKKKN